MISQCPRCGAPRQGEYPICNTCGLDYRSLQQPQWGQPLPTQQVPSFGQSAYQPPTPSSMPDRCPRCGAQLYVGYPACNSCGLSLQQMMPAGSRSSGGSKSAIVLAALGLGLLLAAGGLFVATRPSASPSASNVAAASASPKATVSASPRTSVSVVATVEPSPASEWTTFKPTDKTWSAKFPGTAKPTKTTQDYDSGLVSTTMVMYWVTDVSSEQYAVMYMDLSTAMARQLNTPEAMDAVAKGMASSSTGTVASSKAVTVSGHAGREMVVSTTANQVMTCQVFVSGTRLYLLIAGGPTSGDVYPQHFFSSFALTK
jgi:hypothetical protein